jgi:hypothetical protein
MIIFGPRLSSCKEKSDAQYIFRMSLAYNIVYTTTLASLNFCEKSVSFDTYQFRFPTEMSYLLCSYGILTSSEALFQ